MARCASGPPGRAVWPSGLCRGGTGKRARRASKGRRRKGFPRGGLGRAGAGARPSAPGRQCQAAGGRRGGVGGDSACGARRVAGAPRSVLRDPPPDQRAREPPPGGRGRWRRRRRKSACVPGGRHGGAERPQPSGGRPTTSFGRPQRRRAALCETGDANAVRRSAVCGCGDKPRAAALRRCARAALPPCPGYRAGKRGEALRGPAGPCWTLEDSGRPRALGPWRPAPG